MVTVTCRRAPPGRTHSARGTPGARPHGNSVPMATASPWQRRAGAGSRGSRTPPAPRGPALGSAPRRWLRPAGPSRAAGPAEAPARARGALRPLPGTAAWSPREPRSSRSTEPARRSGAAQPTAATRGAIPGATSGFGEVNSGSPAALIQGGPRRPPRRADADTPPEQGPLSIPRAAQDTDPRLPLAPAAAPGAREPLPPGQGPRSAPDQRAPAQPRRPPPSRALSGEGKSCGCGVWALVGIIFKPKTDHGIIWSLFLLQAHAGRGLPLPSLPGTPPRQRSCRRWLKAPRPSPLRQHHGAPEEDSMSPLPRVPHANSR